MRVLLVALILATSACGYRKPNQGWTVTITLPPPKPVSTPGFSTAMNDPLP
jgi:hypothetical protein